jgi:membrane-bound lytic murein transglycosylase A
LFLVKYFFIFSFFVGCAQHNLAPIKKPDPSNELSLTLVSFDNTPGWAADNHNIALSAFLRSCGRFLSNASDGQMKFGHVTVKRNDFRRVCKKAGQVNIKGSNQDGRLFFETWFKLYQVSYGNTKKGLFTGYYEPVLQGSRKRSFKYNTALFRRPSDLITADLGRFRVGWSGRQISGRLIRGRLVPYFSRAEIENGILNGKGLEFLWVDNFIDAFFLHIQGSGRVVLDTGELVKVGFAGRNGHPYYAIGRDLVKRGLILKEKISLQTIRDWLENNPTQATELMNKNKSYIFFREHKATKTKRSKGEGPIGAAGVSLTPGRSLAVDRKYFAMGIPIWINTKHPIKKDPLRRLMIAQDTGGAIVGPIRGDFFWGTGLNAREAAGKMREEGQVYILLPNQRK